MPGQTISPQNNAKTAISKNDRTTRKGDVNYIAENRIHFVATNWKQQSLFKVTKTKDSYTLL